MAGDWKLLDDCFYRKVEISPMSWAIDLSKYVIAAASFGGSIAVMKKTIQTNRFLITIFNSVGKEMGVLQWNSGRILKMGWSNREELLCLQDDGNVLVYDIFGKYLTHFSMGKDASDVKVIDGQIFITPSGSTGIAILISTHRFFIVQNIYDIKLKQLPELPDWNTMPSSWCVISRDSHATKLLVAKDADLYAIDVSGSSTKSRILKSNQIVAYTEMSVSLDNKSLALFNSLGVLWIGSSDLKETYYEHNTGNFSRPTQLVWCRNIAVVAKWDNYLLLFGPTESHVKFEFDAPFYLVPEIDGIRIIGENSLEFLQKVPRELENVFKIGSVSPEVWLFEASRLFHEEKKECLDCIKTVSDQLPNAYLSCLRAASHEFNAENQKELLKAASFGKCFLKDLKTDDAFMDVCQKLRMLNSLRSFDVGIALTIVQLGHLTLEVLIERLLLRKLFWLAFEICSYLKVPSDDGVNKVLSRWACDKIQLSTINDDQLAEIISMKLQEHKGVSYTQIINKAIECGRTRLALNLINFEPTLNKQIPLLMKLNREYEVLSKAIESGDNDLVALVLMHWKDKVQHGEFLRNISQFPVAYSIYLKHCKEQSREMLLDLHYQADNHLEQALCKVAMSFEEEPRYEQKLNYLQSAKEAFDKSKKDIFSKLTEEHVKLVKYQIKFEEELDRPFLDKSLNQTLQDLFMNGNNRHFDQLKNDFKIPEKRVWSMKIQALAKAGNWAELEKFSRSKKSPIGYEPFLEACLTNENVNEAKNYLSRILPENLVKYHLKLGQIEQAAELALQSNNEDEIDLVLFKCTPSDKAIIEKLKTARCKHY